MSEPILPNAIYDSASVALLVHQRSVEWFYTWRAGEGRLQGFPRPVSPSGHPRWLGADLLAWLRRDQAGDVPARLEGETLVDIRPILRLRSQQMAATGRKRLAQ